MKKILYVCLVAFALTACSESKTVTVTVSNSLPLDRNNEMIELPVDEVSTKLQLADNEQFVVVNAQGEEVPYQITSDEKLIFPVNVSAGSNVVYTVKVGNPSDVSVLACGRHYPERVDDIAWENELGAYRAYGPALQRTGERAFGYDIWTKYNTVEPVVEARYAIELNSETLAKIDSLRKVDPQAARELRAATSYHVDHGNGLDCYKVGPTLGGGTAALIVDGNILYPYCYKEYEILDNGPLRFAVKLVYDPIAVRDNEAVIETRIVSLDAGSYLNKTVISYAGLSEATEVATGLVLHEPAGEAVFTADAAKGFITYVDPTDTPDVDNGKVLVGAAFPGMLKEAKPVYFSQEEKVKERGGAADGHLLAISDYQPGSNYTYYWGGAWTKAGMDTAGWDKYVAEYAQKVRNQLTVTIE